MTSESNQLITITNLVKIYYTGNIAFTALREVNMSVMKGEMIAISGASGSGKSTLMNILGCLDRPTKGKYLFKDMNTTIKTTTELAHLRRENFGFVFQSYNLLPRTTTFENVELPLLYGTKFGRNQRKEIVINALEKVSLKDKVNNKTNELSGGQQQRVAIARAIVNNPSVIFADEPTGNLDTRTSFEIMTIFQNLNTEGTTIILVTHEHDIADFAKRKIIFRDGKIISDNPNTTIKSASEELKKLPVQEEDLISV